MNETIFVWLFAVLEGFLILHFLFSICAGLIDDRIDAGHSKWRDSWIYKWSLDMDSDNPPWRFVYLIGTLGIFLIAMLASGIIPWVMALPVCTKHNMLLAVIIATAIIGILKWGFPHIAQVIANYFNEYTPEKKL